MTTEEMVVDVSQDWVLACDVQQGFMQAPCTASDSLDYSARCRQVRALGGDCYNFIALKNDRMATGRWRCLGQRPGCGTHDRQCAVLPSDSGIVYRR